MFRKLLLILKQFLLKKKLAQKCCAEDFANVIDNCRNRITYSEFKQLNIS